MIEVLLLLGLLLLRAPARGGDIAVEGYRGYLIGTRVEGAIARWSIWDVSAGTAAVLDWHERGTGTVPGILVSGWVEGKAADALAFAKRYIDEEIEAHGRVRGVSG